MHSFQSCRCVPKSHKRLNGVGGTIWKKEKEKSYADRVPERRHETQLQTSMCWKEFVNVEEK
jgi:hypothetical protein